MQIFLLPQAQEDLGFIEDPLLQAIIEKIGLLKEYPYWGAQMEGPFLGYRSFVVGIFRVIYKIVANTRIEVTSIRHCKRELKL
jgi:plasmid stabilization system protein ParE